MPIESQNPAVVPAVESKVYDKWWIDDIVATRVYDEYNVPTTSFRVVFVRYRIAPDGTYEFQDSSRVAMTIPDLFREAQVNETVAGALGAFMGAVATLGYERGVIQ